MRIHLVHNVRRRLNNSLIRGWTQQHGRQHATVLAICDATQTCVCLCKATGSGMGWCCPPRQTSDPHTQHAYGQMIRSQHPFPLVVFMAPLLTNFLQCSALPCCAVSCRAVLQGLTYDQAQATINGTVSVQVPHWLEVLLHHTNHHLPAHVSISIPSYNLTAAQVSTRPGSASLSCVCLDASECLWTQAAGC